MSDVPDRLTIVERVYHEDMLTQRKPFEITSRFHRSLTTRDQVYERVGLSVGEKWEPLDCGWLNNNVGMLVIKNEEGGWQPTIPSPEMLVAIAARILEVSFSPTSAGTWLIPPGETMRGMPSETDALRIRCRQGEGRFSIYAIPK